MVAMRRATAVHHRDDWPEDQAIDAVTIAYLDRHRRRIRLVADSGETFLLDLSRAHHLAEGDGLELEGGGFIRVHAAAEPVLEIEAGDCAALLRIAGHLGNRHLPLQVTSDRLRIRADRVIAEMVAGLDGHLTARDAPFDPEIGAYVGSGRHHPDHEDS
jgi:urease accessory protein